MIRMHRPWQYSEASCHKCTTCILIVRWPTDTSAPNLYVACSLRWSMFIWLHCALQFLYIRRSFYVSCMCTALDMCTHCQKTGKKNCCLEPCLFVTVCIIICICTCSFFHVGSSTISTRITYFDIIDYRGLRWTGGWVWNLSWFLCSLEPSLRWWPRLLPLRGNSI